MARLYKNTINKKTYYIDEFGNFYYPGQILEHYDYKGNFLYYIIIHGFSLHYRAVTKEKYLTICFSEYGKNYKFRCELNYLNTCNNTKDIYNLN